MTTLKLTKFLTKKVLKWLDDESNPTFMATMNTWNYNDFMCSNYILNGLHFEKFWIKGLRLKLLV
jgi:hypothetical protein